MVSFYMIYIVMQDNVSKTIIAVHKLKLPKNIYIILIIFVQCFGAGSVMLWDKESIKLKFVSAAAAGIQSSSASTHTVALAQNFTPST